MIYNQHRFPLSAILALMFFRRPQPVFIRGSLFVPTIPALIFFSLAMLGLFSGIAAASTGYANCRCYNPTGPITTYTSISYVGTYEECITQIANAAADCAVACNAGVAGWTSSVTSIEPCSGSPTQPPGGGGDTFFETLFPNNTGGSGIASGAGGLINDFGTTRLTGPEQGQPTFTSHATTANKQWMEEAQRRLSTIGSLRDTPVPKTTADFRASYVAKVAKQPSCLDHPGAVCLMGAGRTAPSLEVMGRKPQAAGDAPPVMGGGAYDRNRNIKIITVPPPPKEVKEKFDYRKQPGYSVAEMAGGLVIEFASKSGVPVVSQVAQGAKVVLDTADVLIRGQEIYNNEEEKKIKRLDEIKEQQELFRDNPEKLKELTEKSKSIKFNQTSTYIAAHGIAMGEKAATSVAADSLPGEAPGGARKVLEDFGKKAGEDWVIKPVVEAGSGRVFELGP